jgi:DUF1680 family protein
MRTVVASLLALGLLSSSAALTPPRVGDWRDQGVLHLERSPYARLRSVPVRAVTMGEGFWSGRMRANVERSIPTLLTLLEQHGIVDNFRRLSGRVQAERRGPLYTDSDVYKWMEAAGFALQTGDDPALRATFDRLVDDILSAQEATGYLNTYYVDDRVPKRFTELVRSHEEYCLGHLLQAGIAYYRATGSRRLLDGGIRMADYFVEHFGPDKRPMFTGHPELELAMVELYRTTGERKYLDFAGYLLSGVERERLGLRDRDVVYTFSGVPFTSRTKFEGHAVRAMYAASGATDYYLETGDRRYWDTLDRLWRDLATSKMYVTGGVGSRSEDEAIGEPYELPNAQAYGESCAAIGNMIWNWRMLMATGEARFADIVERALYNGVNSGMSIDGTLYCYRNPLESSGEKIRNEWYTTTCCPPNLQRILASLPGYLYSTSDRGLYIHLYHASTVDWHLADGTGLKVSQATGYPWTGAVDVSVTPATRAEFSLFLRVPAWSERTRVRVNDEAAVGEPKAGGYFEIRRRWQTGDRVHLELDVTPRLTLANPLVRENVGRVAVERGPLVYALEQEDQPDRAPLFDLSLAPSGAFEEQFRRDLLAGVLVLRHPGLQAGASLSSQPLYRRADRIAKRPGRPITLTFIPYYAWANRAPQPMLVWVPRTGD